MNNQEHTCINCTFFEEGICIMHSQGYEAHVSHPYSHGKDCKDFEAYEEESSDSFEDDDYENSYNY